MDIADIERKIRLLPCAQLYFAADGTIKLRFLSQKSAGGLRYKRGQAEIVGKSLEEIITQIEEEACEIH